MQMILASTLPDPAAISECATLVPTVHCIYFIAINECASQDFLLQNKK